MKKIRNVLATCLLVGVMTTPVFAANLDDMSDVDVLAIAQKGQAEAQYKIGDVYYYGSNDTEQDFDQARFWYEKAAQQGNADAEYSLGVMYDNGEGVEQNPKKPWLTIPKRLHMVQPMPCIILAILMNMNKIRQITPKLLLGIAKPHGSIILKP
jgi:hypothetical protein